MNFVLPRRTVSIVLALAATATFFAPLQAQTHTEPEPVLDALRAAFNQEGLRLGMLLQTVLAQPEHGLRRVPRLATSGEPFRPDLSHRLPRLSQRHTELRR